MDNDHFWYKFLCKMIIMLPCRLFQNTESNNLKITRMFKKKKINCKNSCVYNYFLRGQAANSKLSKEDMIKDRRTLLQTSTSNVSRCQVANGIKQTLNQNRYTTYYTKITMTQKIQCFTTFLHKPQFTVDTKLLWN